MEKLKASDLRIGNYVNYLDEVIQIANISRADKLEGVKPIKLTEDWLIRFGFEKDSEFRQIHLNILGRLSFEMVNDDLYLQYNETKDRGILFNKIKTVHALQNLYYALTNEELTIKTD